MPQSFSLKGKFFSLTSVIGVLQTKGYRISSTQIRRLISNPDIDAIDVRYMQVGLDKDFLFNVLEQISGVKIKIHELNFNSYRIISNESEKLFQIDNRELMNKLSDKKEVFWKTFETGPIIATTKFEREFNYKFLDEYINKLDFDDKRLNVITGEMVWSTWLDGNMIAYIFSKKLNQSTYCTIDFNGLWDFLIHDFDKKSLLREFNQFEFAPNAYYFKFQTKSKNINIYKNEVTREITNDNKARMLTDLKDYKLEGISIPSNLLISGEGKNLLIVNGPAEFVDGKLSIVYKPNDKFELIDPDLIIKLKNGTRIDKGDVIGTEEITMKNVYKLSDLPKLLEIVVSHGQIVEKNEIVAYNRSISGKLLAESIRSPIKGVIDLSHFESGFVLIKEPDSKEVNYRANFSGVYRRPTTNNKYSFQADTLTIPLEVKIGRDISGVLYKKIPKNEENRIKKVLYLRNSKELTENINLLLKENVAGIIFESLSLKEMNWLIKEKYDILEFISVAVLSAYTQDLNPLFRKVISKITSSIVTIKDEKLMFTLNIKNESVTNRNNGRIIRLFSLNRQLKYLDLVRKLSSGNILVTDGKSISEVSKENYLILNCENHVQ